MCTDISASAADDTARPRDSDLRGHLPSEKAPPAPLARVGRVKIVLSQEMAYADTTVASRHLTQSRSEKLIYCAELRGGIRVGRAWGVCGERDTSSNVSAPSVFRLGRKRGRAGGADAVGATGISDRRIGDGYEFLFGQYKRHPREITKLP